MRKHISLYFELHSVRNAYLCVSSHTVESINCPQERVSLKHPPKEIRNLKNKLKCPYILNGVPSYFNV
jgi:hypothetical protein